jgi:hypothetical protein
LGILPALLGPDLYPFMMHRLRIMLGPGFSGLTLGPYLWSRIFHGSHLCSGIRLGSHMPALLRGPDFGPGILNVVL